MKTTTPADAYVPGVCNINREEIASRKKAGYFGVVLYVIILATLVALGFSRWYRLLLFVPAFIIGIGFLQAKHHFCVGYGAAGQQNASEGSKAAISVADQAAIKKDKQRARQLNLQAAGIGLLLTAAALVIPVIN